MQGYGPTGNQGRAAFGRGRMPLQGRGQTMQGRGGRMQMPMGRGGRMQMPTGRGGMMPPGRGGRMPMGRGGRMQMPAGRGGRMQMPARGRGGRMMPGRGRGGRGGGPKPIPSKLDVFNRFVQYKIAGFCNRDDAESLGFAFPQFTPPPLTPEQQKMRMMKKMVETKMEFKDPYGLENDDNDDSTSEAYPADANGDAKGGDKDDSNDTTVASKGGESSAVNGNADGSNPASPDGDEEEKSGEKEESSADNANVDEKNDNSVSESNIACSLDFNLTDGDVMAPTADASCDCERLSSSPKKETKPCNCRSCRETRIQAIQACNCDRCNVLKQKLTQAPIFPPKNDSKSEEAAKAEIDPEKKKQMMKQREEALRINMTDCHTLLAQLNTKRLYHRIKYFKRKDPDYDVDKAYPYNKDTAEISQIEWDALIEEYKVRRMEMVKKKELEDKERAEKKANQKANRSKKSKNKKKKKKGKGKGKKSGKGKRPAQEAAEEAGASTAEKTEDDASVGNESDVDDEKDSDEDVAADAISDSDDESIEEADFEYVADKPSKYELLMFTPCPRAVAVLASYPRSGNSLMRNLYEKITLRVTGSDMMGGLQKHDLVGEMATGTNNVQFVKTHYPERMGHPPFRVSRAVLLVRNPYDAMDSYFNLMTTSTHTTSLTGEQRKKYSAIFAEMAKKEILVWRDFHEYWLKQKIPLMVVRYEDLIRDTVKVVNKVIKFVLEINSMTFFEDRINRAIGEEQVEKLGPYKARSGGIGKSLTKGHYTPQLLNQINYGIQDTMEKFGYKEMLIPNPSSWKLRPIDQWGVFIPGTSNEPMIINQKGLVRGPNRQTNWRQVKMMMEQDKKQKDAKPPEKVNLL